MNSRASSEYSDSHPSFLAPEPTRNSAYSPGPSPYGSPYSRNEDYRQHIGVAGRCDASTEENLFMTYLFFRKSSNIQGFSPNFITFSPWSITRFRLRLPTASVLYYITPSSSSAAWRPQTTLLLGLSPKLSITLRLNTSFPPPNPSIWFKHTFS